MSTNIGLMGGRTEQAALASQPHTLGLPRVEPASLAIQGSPLRFPVRRVFCVGRNYPWPLPGGGLSTQREELFYFMKPSDAVVPAEGQLLMPPLTQEFCPEVELVVALGVDGAQIAPHDALNHVWGYGVGLDMTRRDLQMAAKQAGRPWEGAKAFDASAPCSPLLPAANCPAPSAGAIWLTVNGVQRQRADLADLLWSVPEVISRISHFVTLRAGDLIFTGTPAGVGPVIPGDQVQAGVDGIATIALHVGS